MASLDGFVGRDAIETTADVQQAIALADGGITTSNVTATTLNTNLMTITNDQITPLGSSTNVILNTSTTGAFKIDNLQVKTNTVSSTNTDGDIVLAPNGNGKVTTDNLALDGNTISSTNTDGDIVLAPNGNGKVTTDNLALDGNTISSTNTDGDIVLAPNGNGKVTTDNLALDGNTVSSTNTDGDIVLAPNGNGKVTTDNLALDGNTISSTNTDGNIILAPNGAGNIVLGTMTLNADQTVSASEDDYVLKYDHSSGTIGLEAEAGGGSSLWTQNGSDIYYNSGAVGIGTTTPQRDLQVRYTGSTQSRFISLVGGNLNSELLLGSDSSGCRVYARDITNANNGRNLNINLGDTVGDAIRMVPGTSTADFGIGIGTTDPKAKVHISGDYSGYGVLNSGANKYFSAFNSTTSLGYASSGVQSLLGTSLYADDNIITHRYFASHANSTFSDRRIKKEIVDINDGSALDTIRLIKPKQYKYVDTVMNTSDPVWGFIAQECAEVLPYSTMVMNKAIPNVFELKAYSNGILQLPATGLLNDSEGNLIKRLLLKVRGDKEKDVTIKDILEDGVTLEETLQEEDLVEGKVFVYGQYVDDFHVLKKDAIFTVSVSALQEIDRRQVADKEHIKLLEARLAHLEQRLNKANI